jgi:hypothetical protein
MGMRYSYLVKRARMESAASAAAAAEGRAAKAAAPARATRDGTRRVIEPPRV